MAAITGLAPVDPFILGLTQTAGKLTPLGLAAGGVCVAAASNDFAKALVARVCGDSRTGRQSLALLFGFTALGLVPLPSKWLIEFGEPIRTDTISAITADDPMTVFNLTDQVRETIQHTLYRLLSQRRNAFFG